VPDLAGNLESFKRVVPELILGGMAVLVFVLASAARGKKRWQNVIFPNLSALGLIAAFVFLFSPSREDSSTLFFGLMVTDPFSIFFRALVIGATFLGVFLSVGSPSVAQDRKGEYHGLLMTMSLGMCLLAGSNHLLMIYLAMETISLCSYLLTGFDERLDRSREAGLKYVLYGGVASGVMLFGMSLLYGLFGDLSVEGLHRAIATSSALDTPVGQWAALLAVLFVLCGLGYKIAAVPFHMWCPDAYEGAPTPFTALLSVGPKAAGFAVLIRFFYGIFLAPEDMQNLIPAADSIPWVLVIGIVSAVTMTVGNFVAIVQNNLKRLLAYSSIAHAGYVLMGVTAGGTDGFEAVSLYLLIYLIMNMGAFAVVSAVDRLHHSEDIRVYKGLGRRAPLLGLVMAVFLFSLTGLPPTAGFIGKLYLFAALIHRGDFWYIALAVVGIFNSVVSLYYYARVLKTMYLEKTEEPVVTVSVGNMATVLATVLAIPTLVFGIFWQPLARIAHWSANLFH
jgi:NADH-quinone oxidoreductase subunit N